MSAPWTIRRLGAPDIELARRAFAMMAAVFDEAEPRPLDATYVGGLLARREFWALAALLDGEPVGALTAHVLPMTRAEARELFIYDLAVQPAHQRRGIGRALIGALLDRAAEEGIPVAFVPADEEDGHALEFYRALGGAEAPVRIFTFDATPDPDAPARP